MATIRRVFQESGLSIDSHTADGVKVGLAHPAAGIPSICLETYDLASGAVTVVLQTDRHIEAPNWYPDGGSLLVNAEGRLFRVCLLYTSRCV